MSRWDLIRHRPAQIITIGAILLVAAAPARAQAPWMVTLTPTLDPLPVGLCAAIHLTVLDGSGKNAPRNALGARVTIADFDITVSGNGVVANRIDASHWESCACQSAAPASMATVTASYPARSLPANARVSGVTFQRSATFTIAAAKGASNPRACTASAPASSTPSAGTLLQPVPPAAGRTPPASATPAAIPPVGTALPVSAPTVVPTNPSGFTAVQIAPGQVRLSWQAVRGASFYGLFGPGLTAGGERIVGATTFVATNVPAGNQQWAVGSFIDPGNVSTPASAFPRVTLNVTPVPVNPTGFSAVQTGTGQVTLSWQPVTGASFYLLLGPGVTAGGERVTGATTFTATNVPAGLREWAVASFYDPGNVSTVASAFPRVTLNVLAAAPPPTTPPAPPVTTGRYRVVATRFTVQRGSLDDVLDRDGKGDEIYGGFSMFHVNRINGQILDQDLRRTKVHGQLIDGTDRVAAGSATPNGGLADGDRYPSAQSASVSDQTFPFRVWDGTLTNKQDALVLLPSLWESDNDDSNFEDWFLSEKAALPVFWWDASLQSALKRLELDLVTTNTFATGFGFSGLLPATSKDHPVGLMLRPTGFELQRRAIVLTREMLEAVLTAGATTAPGNTAADLDKVNDKKNETDAAVGAASSLTGGNSQLQNLANQLGQHQTEIPSSGRGADTIAIPLVDGAALNLNGNYTLYLRVERLP